MIFIGVDSGKHSMGVAALSASNPLDDPKIVEVQTFKPPKDAEEETCVQDRGSKLLAFFAAHRPAIITVEWPAYPRGKAVGHSIFVQGLYVGAVLTIAQYLSYQPMVMLLRTGEWRKLVHVHPNSKDAAVELGRRYATGFGVSCNADEAEAVCIALAGYKKIEVDNGEMASGRRFA